MNRLHTPTQQYHCIIGNRAWQDNTHLRFSSTNLRMLRAFFHVSPRGVKSAKKGAGRRGATPPPTSIQGETRVTSKLQGRHVPLRRPLCRNAIHSLVRPTPTPRRFLIRQGVFCRYQVVKKWLSYREKALLGRGLKVDKAQHVTEMARRIAVLILMQPELDANYQAVKADTCRWPVAGIWVEGSMGRWGSYS